MVSSEQLDSKKFRENFLWKHFVKTLCIDGYAVVRENQFFCKLTDLCSSFKFCTPMQSWISNSSYLPQHELEKEGNSEKGVSSHILETKFLLKA